MPPRLTAQAQKPKYSSNESRVAGGGNNGTPGTGTASKDEVEADKDKADKDRENIKWDLALQERLAHQYLKKHKEWDRGNKAALARQWAKELGLEEKDPTGKRTKTFVTSMLQHYRQARDLKN